MKKAFLLFVIVLMVVLLNGCIEVIQIISIKNGEIHTSIRYTLQKIILEMGASLSDEVINYDEFLGIGDDTFSHFSGIDRDIKKFVTPFDIGAEITIKGSDKTSILGLDGKNDFIPIKHNDKYILEIPLMGEEDEEVDEFALVLISGAKFRVIISLADDLEHISLAKLFLDRGFGDVTQVSHEEGCTVSINGSVMLIEIPMIIFIMGDGKLVIEMS